MGGFAFFDAWHVFSHPSGNPKDKGSKLQRKLNVQKQKPRHDEHASA
jgi:hypothetical protein